MEDHYHFWYDRESIMENICAECHRKSNALQDSILLAPTTFTFIPSPDSYDGFYWEAVITGSRNSPSPACPWNREGTFRLLRLLQNRHKIISYYDIFILTGLNNSSSIFLVALSFRPGGLGTFVAAWVSVQDVMLSTRRRRNGKQTSSSVALGRGTQQHAVSFCGYPLHGCIA